MTITTNTNGTTVLNADEGRALRRKTDMGPTRIVRVALAATSSPDEWTDCDYAATEDERAERQGPRTFSKLRIVAALMESGVWAQVKSYIEQAGLYDLYLAAQDFAEDNEYFTQGKTALQTALGWTDGQVEAVLQEAAE